MRMDRVKTAVPIIAAIVIVILIALQIILHDNPAWNNFTGIGETAHKTITTTYLVSTFASPPQNSQFPSEITETIESQSGKTLWDWLQLLIVPVVLAIGAYYLNQSERKSEQNIAEERLREDVLQEYLDKMAELMLEKDLQVSKKSLDEIEAARNVARVRTLTALRSLDGRRKGIILRFLNESGLITKGESVIDLSEADLSGVDLEGANLRRANLNKTNLKNANLRGTKLDGALLVEADLSGAMMDASVISGRYRLLGKPKIWAAPTYDDSNSITIRSKKPNRIFGGLSLTGNSRLGIVGRFILIGKISVKATEYTDLSRADLTNANLSDSKMLGVKLQGAKLDGANLRAADLSGAHLVDARLHKAILINTKFIGADMKGVDFQSPIFQVDSFLEKDVPAPTDFTGADLQGVDLSGLSLDGVIFNSADLTDANLDNSDLSGADMQDADVSPEQLNKAKSLAGTIMPDGKKRKR